MLSRSLELLGNHRAKAPFVHFVAFLLAGIGFAYQLSPSPLVYIVVLFVLVLSLLLFFAFRFIREVQIRPEWNSLKGLSFFLAICCLGCLQTWKEDPLIISTHFSRQSGTHLVGILVNEPKMNPNRLTAQANITKIQMADGTWRRATGRLLIHINYTDSCCLDLGYGDEIILQKNAQMVPPPFNPHEFNYKAYLQDRNIWHQSYLGIHQVIKTGANRGNVCLRFALACRREMLNKMERYIAHPDARAILSALVLGYRANLDKELVKAFSSTGTIHVLAVSGMHVGIVFACFSFGLRWMKRKKKLKLVRLSLLLLFVWSYVLLTGFSASVLRAAFMISFVIIGQTFGRQRNVYNNIAASAFFLLLYNPKYIAEIGFQLSYLAVLGIIWLMPPLMSLFTYTHRALKWLYNYISLSCTAQLATFPLVLYYFHLFPVYFLPANMLIVVPVSMIIYAGFLLLLLPASEVSVVLGIALEKFILTVNKLLTAIESWPKAAIGDIWITPSQYLLTYLFVILLVLSFQYGYKKILYAAIICLLLLGSIFNFKRWCVYEREQLIVFNMRKELAIGIVKRGKAIVYSNVPFAEDIGFQYAVMPTVGAYVGMENCLFVRAGATYFARQAGISIEGNLIRFGRKELLIVDRKHPNSHFTDALHWLMIRKNAQIDLAEIPVEVRKRIVLILDASNNKRTRNELLSKANTLGISTYVLNDNFAYVWDANKRF